MYTIRDATNAFFNLDGTLPEEGKALDKALRNLSQRVYMPPAGRKGRADTFAIETICALRLLHKANVFGVDRWQQETLARFLQIAEAIDGGRRIRVDGGFRPLSPIEEAVERVREGESFSIGVRMLSDGTVKPFVGWREAEDEGTEFLADAGYHRLPEDARFTLPASRLIADLIAELEGVS